MFWWWSMAAHAACEVSQSSTPDGVEVQVIAHGRPEGCRLIHLSSSDSLSVRGWWYTPEGSRYRLPASQIALRPGAVWEVVAPQLVDQGRVRLELHFPQGLSEKPSLTIALADQKPEGTSAVERLDQTWTLNVNPRHPGWSFADPTQGSTTVDATWTLLPGAVPELLPVPATIKIESLEGGTALPGAIRSNADTVHLRYEIPGTPAQGDLSLPPGSFVLKGPELDLLMDPLPPAGGHLGWRVAHVGGVAVIPDLATYLSGLTERFRIRSLPEPAVPMALRGMEDRAALFQELFRQVRDMPTLGLPGQEPLHPRPLNQVWQLGWGNAVEKGLILHRLLGQERFERTWVLTGESADPRLLTGYDAMLLQTPNGWLDPGCLACAVGEISARWLGKPSLTEGGGAGTVPRLAGKLRRDITLQGDTFEMEVRAEGEAAVWIREAIATLDPAQQPGRLLRLLGVADGSIVGGEGLDKRGHPLNLRVTSPNPPTEPWPDGEPWG